ncbi:NVEALA domain-containing protein [uncultured Rikenella sp.]|uniref:NVEALA domain-containing protein n=1 Tax=uncultured Rikenella sp. TaxID=368003 RepID=UPI00272C426B|nr:NVEALA domain-containing protein [uncultured Rikenella sp.]
MKKMTKALLAAGGAALICGGAVMTYLKAQTQQPEMSALTLANIEAMADLEEDILDLQNRREWYVKKLDNNGSKDCIPGGSRRCKF